MSKHTPGEWKVLVGEFKWPNGLTRTTYALHPDIRIHRTRKAEAEERRANAQLIGSAPELLEAIKLLVKAASNVHLGGKWDATVLAKKVIAKAESK